MARYLPGLALSLWAGTSLAQTTIAFDVVFDSVYDASGSFVPALTLVTGVPGPFLGDKPPEGPPPLTARVVLNVAENGTQLTGANTITLDGSFSSRAGNAPSNNWATYSFNNATFDLLPDGGSGHLATDLLRGTPQSVNDWPAFLATAADGHLSDHGPAALYGGNCPYAAGCLSANPAGGRGAVSPVDGTSIFGGGTVIYDTASGTNNFPTYRNAGFYPLVSGSVSSSLSVGGLDFDNGLDAFMFAGVLDTGNTQGNGASYPYPDGVNGYPGIVRIVAFSSGATAYMVEGRVVIPAPAPPAAWLVAPALGLLAPWARRRQRAPADKKTGRA